MNTTAPRHDSRDTAGRYVSNPCECCGKGTKTNYFSDERCNTTAHGTMLCEDCADLLAGVNTAVYLRVFGLPETDRKAWKRAHMKAARAAAAT